MGFSNKLKVYLMGIDTHQEPVVYMRQVCRSEGFGTAVDLPLADIRRVVNKTGACLVWGGAINLSPADELLIRIERALDIDGEGQLVASVLSKKIAAGSTHVVIDIPVGDTAKVRSRAEADRLFANVGDTVKIGEPLYELLSDTTGEQDYALAYRAGEPHIFTIEAES